MVDYVLLEAAAGNFSKEEVGFLFFAHCLLFIVY